MNILLLLSKENDSTSIQHFLLYQQKNSKPFSLIKTAEQRSMIWVSSCLYQPRLNHGHIKLKVVQSNVAGLRSATEIINSKEKERNFIKCVVVLALEHEMGTLSAEINN